LEQAHRLFFLNGRIHACRAHIIDHRTPASRLARAAVGYSRDLELLYLGPWGTRYLFTIPLCLMSFAEMTLESLNSFQSSPSLVLLYI
jgi:hypothetical protein